MLGIPASQYMGCGSKRIENPRPARATQARLVLKTDSWVVVVYTFSSSTQETEAGQYQSLRPASSTEQIPGQGYKEKPCLKNKQIKKKTDRQTDNRIKFHKGLLNIERLLCTWKRRLRSPHNGWKVNFHSILWHRILKILFRKIPMVM